MATSTTLTIQGYRGEAVPNRFLRPEGAIDHLAVLLPGFGYTLDMPLFYYAENLLLERGWDVLRVEYAYNKRPEFQTLTEPERDRWLLADRRQPGAPVLASEPTSASFSSGSLWARWPWDTC